MSLQCKVWSVFIFFIFQFLLCCNIQLCLKALWLFHYPCQSNCGLCSHLDCFIVTTWVRSASSLHLKISYLILVCLEHIFYFYLPVLISRSKSFHFICSFLYSSHLQSEFVISKIKEEYKPGLLYIAKSLISFIFVFISSEI